MYNCVPCKRSFTEWRNFKRHTREVHGPSGQFQCHLCPFKTNRGETLKRHISALHVTYACVLEILADMIETVVADKEVCDCTEEIVTLIVNEVVEDLFVQVEATDDSSSDSECDFVDPRVKARNERIALRDAEFQRLFPSFSQEVQALKVVRRRRPREKILLTATRKSQRILGHSVTSQNEIYAVSDDDLANLEEPMYDNELPVADTGSESVGDPEDTEIPVYDD